MNRGQPALKLSPHPSGMHLTPVPREAQAFEQWVNRAGEVASIFLAGARDSQTEWPDRVLAERSVRKWKKDNIRRAFAQGELICRGINIDKESNYQKGPPQPRPGTLIREGMRVNLYIKSPYLGLFPVRELYLYKKDIYSSTQSSKNSSPRWLLPDRISLLNKIAEQDNRLDSLYQPRTSGHMDQSGKHICGHYKFVSKCDYADMNEISIENYRKGQYQCMIIWLPFDLDILYKELQHKVRLDELAGLELPLMFYDPCSGSIKDIVFPSELDITADSLPELKINIDRIKLFAECSSSVNLSEVLSQLPPSNLLFFLRRLPVDIVEATRQLSAPFRNELREAVEQGDLGRVMLYSQHGANLTALYYDESQCLNLLSLLTRSPALAPWASEAHKSNSQKLAEQTQLGKLLYDHGCQIAVNYGVIKSLPSLAAYMLATGEEYDKSDYYYTANTFKILADFYIENIICLNEFKTVIKAIKLSLADKPDKLNNSYTEYIYNMLFNYVLNEFTDIYCNELFIKTLDIFTSFGFFADTKTLSQKLLECAQRYKNKLLVRKNLDKKELKSIRNRARIMAISCDGSLRKNYLRKKYFYDSPSLGTLIDIIKLELYIFSHAYGHPSNKRNPVDSLENARKIAQYLYHDQIETAEAFVEQLYETWFKDFDEKRQARELFIQNLDERQNQKARRRAGAESKNETEATENRAFEDIARTEPRPVTSQRAKQNIFNWLKTLYRFSPDTAGKNYPELAQLAINHYYRMPHPDQAEQFAMSQQQIPDLLRVDHGVDHVTRTQILSEALLELFAKHDQAFRVLLSEQPELQELIPLAMVYHDVTAEVEAKSIEEIRAAEFFERDMNASGRYSPDSVALVASALRNKESDVVSSVVPPLIPDTSCSQQERDTRRIIRLADRTDCVRATYIPEGWKEPQSVSNSYYFDSRLLDLPETSSTGFKEDFDALMEGAKDLAYVTGGIPKSDHSKSGSYLVRHTLLDNNKKRRLKVSRAVNAYDSVKTALDDNVRRKIASFADLFTCQLDHLKQPIYSPAPDCLKIKNNREYLAAIHSELELRQVQLPERMTVLQKMMFEQRGLKCLPQDLQNEVQEEIDRLKERGIQPPLGTLTQKTLESPSARKRLREDYGLQVVSEKRCCEWLKSGEARYDTFYVPRQTGASP